MYAAPMGPPKTAKPIIGGALLLVAGILAMINWIWFVLIWAVFTDLTAGLPVAIPGLEGLTTIFLVCGIIGLIFGLIAMLGGIMALRRSGWVIAILGSILGLLSMGFVFTSSILSLVALILIALSKDEFT